MKEGKKKNNIIDRAKSNMEKNRKEQKVEKFFGVLLKYLNTLTYIANYIQNSNLHSEWSYLKNQIIF